MSLTSSEIVNFFQNKTNQLNKMFLGVFPVNLLPLVPQTKPCGLIINLDPDYLPGSHWVAIYMPENGPSIYFDSFGFSPRNNLIIAFLKRQSSTGWVYNSTRFQNLTSSVCGYYCILFLLCCFKGISLHKFQHTFSSNYLLNDKQVLQIINCCKKRL
jgi:hypothetical protein